MRHFVLEYRERNPKPRDGSEPTYGQCCALLAITQSCTLNTSPFAQAITYSDLLEKLRLKELAEFNKAAKSCGLEVEWQRCLDLPTGAFKAALEPLLSHP